MTNNMNLHNKDHCQFYMIKLLFCLLYLRAAFVPLGSLI